MPTALTAAQPRPRTIDDARALYRKGDLTRAVQLYDQLVQQTPDRVALWLDLAALFREMGQKERAMETLVIARALAPQNPDIPAELGWLHFHQVDYGKAQDLFDEALLIDETHSGATLGAAAARLAQNRPQAAMPFLNHLKQVHPNQAIVYYFLGLASEQSNALPEAAELWTTALQKDWYFAETRLSLARVYETQNDVDNAWGQYARYLNFFPRNAPTYKKQQALRFRLSKKPHEIIPFASRPFTPNLEPVPGEDLGPAVRVGINTNSEGRPRGFTTLTFRFSGPFRVVGARSGTVYARGNGEALWQAKMHGRKHLVLIGPDGRRTVSLGGTVRLEPLDPRLRSFIINGMPTDADRTGWDDREYRGTLELTPLDRVLSPVNRVHIESYLLGVVPSEVPARWPMEVLKVQAVIARNQTLMRRQGFRRHRRYGYDLCDSQHCQVYGGVQAEDARVREAVLATRGEAVYYKGGLANTLYHSTCGGFIQRSSDISGWYEVPYLQRRADAEPGQLESPGSPWAVLRWNKGFPPAYCNAPDLSPGSEFRWVRIISADSIQRHLGKRYPVGRIKHILPVGRTAGGNVRELRIIGTKRTLVIKKENMIRYLMGSLRSTLFMVETHEDGHGQAESFWVYGGGWGHAVGLCQTGAASQAASGKTYKEIIPFYYPGVTIKTVNP